MNSGGGIWGFEDLGIWRFGDLGILGVDLETRKKIPYTLHTRLRFWFRIWGPRTMGRWADGPMGRGGRSAAALQSPKPAPRVLGTEVMGCIVQRCEV